MALSKSRISSLTEVNLPIFEKFGYTDVNVAKLSYMWTISNFTFCPQKTGEKLRSPEFTAGSRDEPKWRLDMYPKGNGNDSKDYLSLYLYLVASKKSVNAKFRFSIMDRKMEKTNSMEIKEIRTFGKSPSNTTEPDYDYGYTKFYRRDELMAKKEDLLPDDKLTICCEVSVGETIVNFSGIRNNSITFEPPQHRFLDDFGILLDSEKFSDITLAVGDVKFRAHKNILALRSRVFGAMFEHDMMEMKNNEVQISGMDAGVFGEMLRFVYTGRTINIDKMADGLLYAADKYDLEALKASSETVLCKNLSIVNAADYLMLADLHCAERLKTQAMNFIIGHVKDVMETAGYKTMVTSKPSLIAEVLQTVASRKNREVDDLSQPRQKKQKYR